MMVSNVFSRWRLLIGILCPSILACALLLPGIGSFGMWRPQETDRADIAQSFLENSGSGKGGSTGLHIGERIVAAGWKVLGRSELGARLPLAAIGLASVASVFFLLLPLGGLRLASYAAFVLASSPVLLFHSRQLTSGIPVLFGETLAFGGLALLAYGDGGRQAIAGAVASATGLLLGWISCGLLSGVAVPAFSIFLTLTVTGDAQARFSSEIKVRSSRQAVALGTFSLSVLAAGAFASIVYFSKTDIPLITGGQATVAQKSSFDFPIEQLAYGWFPWSAFVPIALIGLVGRKSERDSRENPLRALVISGIVAGCLAQGFSVSIRGITPFFLVVPISLAVALAIRDLERSKTPLQLEALIAIVLFVLMIRDFAQRPEKLLIGFGFEKLSLPSDFKPVVRAAIFSLPAGIMMLLLGFVGADEKGKRSWKSLRSLVLVPAAAASFGGYLTHMLVPDLSKDLSPRYAIEAYERFKRGDEPLGVYGLTGVLPDSKRLSQKSEVVNWLKRRDRAFVLFPPKDLVEIDRLFRKDEGRHIFVLDSKSSLLMLATSQPVSGEKDQNPIAPFVLSKPFDPAPQNQMNVNFGDTATFLGWNINLPEGKTYLERGSELKLTTYWRCDADIEESHKMFIHMDGSGGRMHGDHDILDGLYSTDKWEAGDYIKDVYSKKIPMYQRAGLYSVKLGLYSGSKRMQVKGAKSEQNAVQIAKIEIR